MRFADVIGHSELKARLAVGAAAGRFGHALLFSGRNGHGTLPLAHAFAQLVNCEAPSGGDSCGVCSSCVKTANLAHPDLHFVFPVAGTRGNSSAKATSDLYIKQWRELYTATGGYFAEADWYRAMEIENQQGFISRAEADEMIRKLSFKPFEKGYKVMVVWLPEKMRVEAANALLKILEEPWEKTLFLMVSESPSKLLPTITSRLQEIHVPGIDDGAVRAFLETRAQLSADRLDSAVKLARGDIFEALSIAVGDGDADREFFELFAALMRLSYNDRHMELLDWGERVASMGREQQKRFLGYCLAMLRENYILGAGMEQIAYLCGQELDFSRRFSPFIGNHNVEPLLEEIESAVAQIGQNGNPRIIFPHFALSVSKLITRVNG
ncbi:MAG: DNA polymerase III subunit delta [Rikenellaceae bacterium]|nr:DNA polymerase III subunit delta [Rikenellaceae bacterium]